MSLRPSIPRSLTSCPPSLAEHASLLSKRSYISPHLSIPPGVSTTWQSLGHHRVISLRKFGTWQSLWPRWCIRIHAAPDRRLRLQKQALADM